MLEVLEVLGLIRCVLEAGENELCLLETADGTQFEVSTFLLWQFLIASS